MQTHPATTFNLATKEGRGLRNAQILNLMEKLIVNLWSRWLDEKEYEDFSEYSKVMESALKEKAPDCTFIKSTKRPFGLIIQVPGMPYKTHLCATGKYLGWKGVK